MRKFLVKHFILDFWFIINGKKFNAPRASRIIFPLMIITGYAHTVHNSVFSWGLVILSFISLYFGFFHFRLFPVNWEELDDNQKFQYGFYKKLSKSQYEEWLTIINKIHQ